MKIAVIGAGGVGGYFGARLQAAGEQVAFIQRGPHGAAMRECGLKVRSALGDIDLPHVRVEAHGAGIEAVDVVLIAVKSNHTEDAGRLARPLIGSGTAVISLQNGVENEARLAALVGHEHVLGATCYILSLIEAPGVVRHATPGARLIFGELHGSATSRARAFHDACANAGIDIELTADIAGAIWAKFAALCPHNGMTAVTRLPIGPIREDADCGALLDEAAREIVTLAEARGVDMPPEVIADPMHMFRRVPADMTSSTYYDLIHGKALEVEWLNGAVVRLGADAGIPTPVNRFIYACLKLHAAGGA